jgi:hypothetical protein
MANLALRTRDGPGGAHVSVAMESLALRHHEAPAAGVSLGGAAAPKERYGLISGPFWGAFGFSAGLVRSAPACAIPITAAPPSGAPNRYSSFAMFRQFRHTPGAEAPRGPRQPLDQQELTPTLRNRGL